MMPEKQTFTDTIKKAGGGGVYVVLTLDVEEAFGAKRPIGKVLIEGIPSRTTLMRMGLDCHILGILNECREQIGKTFGDEVTVSIEADTDPRLIEVPKD